MNWFIPQEILVPISIIHSLVLLPLLPTRLPSEDDRGGDLENRSQWLQAGLLSLPPLTFDVNKRLGNPGVYKREQRAFLKTHDKMLVPLRAL